MPAAQTFWAATSTDGRALDWKVREGEWSVVAMNADGSPGVSVDAKIGAKLPLIGGLGWGLAIPGAVLGLVAIALIVAGARGTRSLDAKPEGPRERALRPAFRRRQRGRTVRPA